MVSWMFPVQPHWEGGLGQAKQRVTVNRRQQTSPGAWGAVQWDQWTKYGHKSPGMRKSLHPVKLLKGFPESSAGKESACKARDPQSIPGLGRSPGEGIGYPVLYSGLEKSMDSP